MVFFGMNKRPDFNNENDPLPHLDIAGPFWRVSTVNDPSFYTVTAVGSISIAAKDCWTTKSGRLDT